MGVATVLFGMAAMVAKGAALQQLAAMGEMAVLIAPLAPIRNPPVISKPSLSDKPLALQDLHRRQSPGTTVCKDEGALDGATESPIPIGSRDPPQAVFVLVLVRVHRRTEPDQIVRCLLVLDAEMSSAVDLRGEGSVSFVPQCPINDHSMVLVWFEEPLLMWSQRGAVFLIGASVKGAGVEVAIEAHTGLEEGVRSFDTITNERGQLLAAFAIWNGEEVSWRMGKLFKSSLEVSLPAWTGMDTGLWLPVLLVVVETLRPVGR
jgi:hypothetical protein